MYLVLFDSMQVFSKYLTSLYALQFSTTKVEFPSLTICPDYDVAYKEDILKEYKISIREIRKLRFPDTKSQNLTSLDFFKLSTHNLTEIVTSMTIKTLKNYPPSTNFTKVTMYDVNKLGVQNDTITTMKIPLNERHWTSQTYLLFGRCFSFAIPKNQKQHGVSSIIRRKPT